MSDLDKLITGLENIVQTSDAEKLQKQIKYMDILASGMITEGRHILTLEREVAQLKEQLSKK
jgi:hypothetical protein